jgi:hypothetical protein
MKMERWSTIQEDVSRCPVLFGGCRRCKSENHTERFVKVLHVYEQLLQGWLRRH